jgi:hypothetical protein
LLFSSMARVTSGDADPSTDDPTEYRVPSGGRVRTGHPVLKAVLGCLIHEWPEQVEFEPLMEATAELLGKAWEPEEFSEVLLRLHATKMVELDAMRYPVTPEAGERPRAFPIALAQAAKGEHVTTVRHVAVRLSTPIALEVLRLADGTRDRAAILRDARKSVPEATAEAVEDALGSLARVGLLAE